ncbi:MAG TPA: hypothetical protein VID27_16990 [Blastocatellia bacterium]|jgi:hypothetical protein
MRLACATLIVVLLPFASAQAQNKKLRIFRGSVAFKRVEMKLNFDGANLSGTYLYSSVGKDLTLRGKIDKGQITLQEFDATGKQIGKFVCKLIEASDENPLTRIEGKWSRADGTSETEVYLSEQNIEFTNGWQIVTKVEKMPRIKLTFYYPQIVGNSPAIVGFNRRVAAIVAKAVKDFKDGEPNAERCYFDADYNVLLATNDTISIHIDAATYFGGPYPNSDHYTVNYDLREGHEMPLASLFKPGSNYKQKLFRLAIQSATRELNRIQKRDGRESDPPPEELTSDWDTYIDWNTWGITSRGLFVYFSLPHVIEALEENFIPYNALNDILNPNGQAARLRK